MALIQCPNCHNCISDKASVCPNCGKVLTSQSPREKSLFFAIIAIFAYALMSVITHIYTLNKYSELWNDSTLTIQIVDLLLSAIIATGCILFCCRLKSGSILICIGFALKTLGYIIDMSLNL